MRRQLSSAFGAWRQHVEAERQLAAMCARIIAWRAHRRVRALFAAWASLTQREHLGRLADLVGGYIIFLTHCRKKASSCVPQISSSPMQQSCNICPPCRMPRPSCRCNQAGS